MLDYSYFTLIIPVIIFSIITQIRINSAYQKYAMINNQKGLTGAMAAQRVLDHYGITNVRIEHVGGQLTDHYDPRTNVIRLSDGVYGGCSVAAIGVACHEAGHAAQYAQHYVPIKIRNFLLRPCMIGSRIALPLALFGLLFNSNFLMDFGIFFYVAIMLFQLVTLPVEFNASRRAMQVIDSTGMLVESEQQGARKVLKAAAMTYVAAVAASAANLLRLLLLRDRRD